MKAHFVLHTRLVRTAILTDTALHTVDDYYSCRCRLLRPASLSCRSVTSHRQKHASAIVEGCTFYLRQVNFPRITDTSDRRQFFAILAMLAYFSDQEVLKRSRNQSPNQTNGSHFTFLRLISFRLHAHKKRPEGCNAQPSGLLCTGV